MSTGRLVNFFPEEKTPQKSHETQLIQSDHAVSGITSLQVFKAIADKFESLDEKRLKSKALAFLAKNKNMLSLINTSISAFNMLANLKDKLVSPFQNQVIKQFSNCFYQSAYSLIQRAFETGNEEQFTTLYSAINIFTDNIREFENQPFLLAVNDVGYANKIVSIYLSKSKSVYTSKSLKSYAEKLAVTMRLIVAFKEYEAEVICMSDSSKSLPIKQWMMMAGGDIYQKFSDEDPNLDVDATINVLNEMTRIVKSVSLLFLEVRNYQGSANRLMKVTKAGVDIYKEGCALLFDVLQKPKSVDRTNDLILLSQVFRDSASVMKEPTEKNIHVLADTVNHLSGKPSRYKKLLGVCCVLGAILSVSVGIVFAVPSMGLSVAIGLYAAVGLTACAGVGFFTSGRQKGLSKKVSRLVTLQNKTLLLSR